MEKNDKLNWKQEDNNYLNNFFSKLNLIFAFMIIFAPLISSMICLVGIEMNFLNVLLIVYIAYFLVQVINISLNIRFFKFKKPDILKILFYSLLLMIFVNIFVCGVKIQVLFIFGYFIIFDIFYKLEKKYYKILLFSFIIVISVCSIMGMCDLNNSFMPGFDENTFPMSLQFLNPNYSGYITVMAIVLCIYILNNYKKLVEQIVFWICYVVLNVALFINGCFSAETGMFIAELFLVIYLWIKNKKCPCIVLICFGISIVSSFVRIEGYSTSGACYFYEALAVIDNKLGTSLLKTISGFFSKLFGINQIEYVLGSDGWDRNRLISDALNAIFASPKSVVFGNGAGFNLEEIHVHNVYLQIWVDFGIITLLLYLANLVFIAIRTIKTKVSSYNIYIITTLLVTILVSYIFGCLDSYSFPYFICLLSVYSRFVNEKFYSCSGTNNKALSDLEQKTDERNEEKPLDNESEN